jgi:hypothetical protein
MAETKTVTLDVNSNLEQTTKSVGSLKSKLREAQTEVAELSDKFGATSREAVEAAKRAGELKDRISDAKALTEAFNPDAKFKAVTASLTGVAGGFSAITGSMALLGTESDETEKMILKVQSAMAIASGLQAIGESADAFKNMKTVAVDAFKSIKAAIGGTGIGLLVIALGTLITYWDDISKAIGGATEETKAYDEASKEVNETLTKTYQDIDTVNIAFTNAKRGIISKTEALKIYNDKLGNALGKTDDLNVAEQRMVDNTEKYIKAQIARATAQTFIAKAAEEQAKGATGEATNLSWWQKTKLIYAAAIDLNLAAKVADNELTANKTENQKKINFYSDLALKENAKADKITTEINAAGINKRYDDNKKSHEDLAKLKKDAALKVEEEERKKQDKQKASFEYEKSLVEDQLKNTKISIDEKRNIVLNDNKLSKADRQKFLIDLQNQEILAEENHNKAIADLNKRYDDEKLNRLEDTAVKKEQLDYDRRLAEINSIAQTELERQTLIEKLDSEHKVRMGIANEADAKTQSNIEQAKFDLKIQLWNQAAAALGGLGNLFKKNTAAAKVAALGEIAIGSATGLINGLDIAQKSAKGTGPAAAFAFPLFYATQVAAVLGAVGRAKSVLNSGGDGGGSGGGGGASAPSAPSAPSFNVVGNGGANQIAGVMANKEMPPIKTYVVANDVTTQQGLNMNIKNNATIG